MIQWHPWFARLLRPLLEAHFTVETDVPVGDQPRQADIVLVRRTSRGELPFQGIWRLLTEGNVLEFKGPTVSARVEHLDDLVEVGLGVQRRWNEERLLQRQPRVGRERVSWWYLANHLGRRFLRDARQLLGPTEVLEAGVWQARTLQRQVFLVSSRDVGVDRDSFPLHLLAREPEERTLAAAQVVAEDPALWQEYGVWLASTLPSILEEVIAMARTRSTKVPVNLRPVVEYLGMKEAVAQLGEQEVIDAVGVRRAIDLWGVKRVVEEVGLKRVIDEVGPEAFLAALTPKQRREVFKRLQEEGPERPGRGTT